MSAATRESIGQKMVELEKLTRKMNVPEFRRTSIPWLSRNLAIQNSKHPDFERASGLVSELARMGVR